MAKKDPRVDQYIANAADFAKPILKEIRQRVHADCPEAEETLKWSTPTFDYEGILCSMAAFKQHCAFGFWKSALVLGDAAKGPDAAGQFGKLTQASDLPKRQQFRDYVRKAMELNEAGVTVKRAARAPKADIAVPSYFAAALKKNKKALATFEGFSPSHRREYLEWVT